MATLNNQTSNISKKSQPLTDAITAFIATTEKQTNANGEARLSKNRIAAYGSFKKIIETYQSHTQKTYDVMDVNPEFTDGLLDFLLHEKDYSVSYAKKKISDLKTICLNAKKQGFKVHPELNNIETKKEKKQNVIFLNPSELEKIKNLTHLDDDLQNARKWFLLGCNIGQRSNDLLALEPANFLNKNGIVVIEMTQEKTGQIITIPNTKEIKSLLYTGFPKKVPVQKLNNQIKELCQLAKIDEVISGVLYDEQSKRRIQGEFKKYKLITSHACRRTFAMNFYGKMPSHLLKKITGHTTEGILLQYLGKEPKTSTSQNYSLF